MNNYTTSKTENTQPKMAPELRKYIKLLDGKEVLDLGVGKGYNSVLLSNFGFNVTGVDISKESLKYIEENFDCANLTLINKDVREFEIEKNKYDLILSSNVLHFIPKEDFLKIIKKIKENLKEGGLIYISVFSKKDPSLKLNKDFKKNTCINYFSKDEILDTFSDFTTILISDEYSLDLGHGKPHYHGIIKYVGKKQKINEL